MTYMQYLQDYIGTHQPGEPIYTEQLADALAAEHGMTKKNAAAATAVAIKRIMDRKTLPELRLLYLMGLTTQMPAERLLATNAAKDCVRYDRRLEVSVCPPKAPINAENKAYLQTLDALDLLDRAPVDADDPYALIADHIRRNGLQYETLLYYAGELPATCLR